MAVEWYYQQLGRQFGPIAPSALKRLAQAGKIAQDTLVRKGAEGGWVRAERVRGLFDEPKPPEVYEFAKPAPPAAPIISEAPRVVPIGPRAGARVSMSAIQQKYWWLFVPFLSWIGLVFPLILAIPLGPIVVGVAWNRRDWMPHVTRALRVLGRKKPELTFPWGFLRNSFINLADMGTLGLSHLFVTASLHDELAKKARAAGSGGDFSAAAWVAKWLFLANVGFVLAYVACPGLCFGKTLQSMEEHLKTLESGLATPHPQSATKPASTAPPAPGAAYVQSRETPDVKKVTCTRCGKTILASTAEKTGGLCRLCAR